MNMKNLIERWGGVTEEYPFYNGSVILRYDPAAHVYLLQGDDGSLKQVDGVTTVCHIIDKSNALVPWAAKMVYQKLLRTVKTHEVENSDGTRTAYVAPMTFEEFEKLAFEAKSAHKDKLEEAGETGHIAHAWIESYIKLRIALAANEENGKPSIEDFAEHMAKLDDSETMNEKSSNCCRAALDWMHKHNIRWISTERKVYHRMFMYAGTTDGLCRCNSCSDPRCCPEPFEDRLTVADWKTSNYLYLEYVLQTAAYMAAINDEMLGSRLPDEPPPPQVTDRWVIRLGKEDAEFEPWHLGHETFHDDFDGFVECLDLTRRVAQIAERIAARKSDLAETLKQERDRARSLKEASERAERLRVREERKQARLVASQLACAASYTYHGKRKPTCTSGKGGEPCVSHAFKWAKAQEGENECLTNETPNLPKNSIPSIPPTKPNPDLAVLVSKRSQHLLPSSNPEVTEVASLSTESSPKTGALGSENNVAAMGGWL